MDSWIWRITVVNAKVINRSAASIITDLTNFFDIIKLVLDSIIVDNNFTLDSFPQTRINLKF